MIKGYSINSDGLAVPSKEVIDYKKKENFKTIGIPSEYWDMSIENFTINQDASGNELPSSEKNQKRKAYEITQQYSENIDDIIDGKDLYFKSNVNDVMLNSQNLIYYGDGGSGKTLLSTIILKSAIEIDPNVVFLPWIYIYEILSDYNEKNNADILENKIIESKLVIIDGITDFAYNMNSFFLRKMEYIMARRNYERRPSVWTSYIGGNRLCEMFGPIVNSFIKNSIIIKLPNGTARDIFKEI